MESLTTILESCTTTLSAITPDRITANSLSGSKDLLEKIDIHDAIDQYQASLPARPEEEGQVAGWQELMQERSDALNTLAAAFNRELTRIKQMQEALNIPQLEELIHAAQQVIRPVYALTAGLNG